MRPSNLLQNDPGLKISDATILRPGQQAFRRPQYFAASLEVGRAAPLGTAGCCTKPKPSLGYLPKSESLEGGQWRHWERPASAVFLLGDSRTGRASWEAS